MSKVSKSEMSGRREATKETLRKTDDGEGKIRAWRRRGRGEEGVMGTEGRRGRLWKRKRSEKQRESAWKGGCRGEDEGVEEERRRGRGEGDGEGSRRL